jgi:hypothetical protein
MSFAEELPVYASKVQQTIEPISKKIQNFQQSAGNLANDVHATKKVPEVWLQQSPTWPDYLVRGVGSVWGALIIAGVVPFLTFFMLCTKDQMAIRMDGLFDSRIDAARFITNLNQMIRGFVAGNLIVGSVMAVATTLVLWSLWHQRCHTSRNRQRALESAALPRADRCACSSSCSGAPSVQHTRTIRRHHSHDPLPHMSYPRISSFRNLLPIA